MVFGEPRKANQALKSKIDQAENVKQVENNKNDVRFLDFTSINKLKASAIKATGKWE